MSIVPMSLLSAGELAHLGNNLRPSTRASPAARRRRHRLRAVNRSLAFLNEQVSHLNGPPITSVRAIRPPA